jgi:hypothetical protein
MEIRLTDRTSFIYTTNDPAALKRSRDKHTTKERIIFSLERARKHANITNDSPRSQAIEGAIHSTSHSPLKSKHRKDKRMRIQELGGAASPFAAWDVLTSEGMALTLGVRSCWQRHHLPYTACLAAPCIHRLSHTGFNLHRVMHIPLVTLAQLQTVAIRQVSFQQTSRQR